MVFDCQSLKKLMRGSLTFLRVRDRLLAKITTPQHIKKVINGYYPENILNNNKKAKYIYLTIYKRFLILFIGSYY